MRKAVNTSKRTLPSAVATARCVCGAVRLEIAFPAFWAWHDHSEASRRAQGCAYATYVGTWRSRFRVAQGEKHIRHFEDKTAGATRSFCAKCGTPLIYVRARAPKWVNIPRAIFESRTGREPRYHLSLQEAPEWSYRGEPLSSLKKYPGVMWARPHRKPSRREPPLAQAGLLEQEEPPFDTAPSGQPDRVGRKK